MRSIFNLCLFAVCSMLPISSMAREIEAGRDYQLIDPPIATGNAHVVVTEVFSYACPHCAHFEEVFAPWKRQAPKNVVVELVPAVFNPAWAPFARAFYTAQSLGVLDQTHEKLFLALHQEHKPFRTLDELANDFYAGFGVNPQSFISTSSSFVIEAEMARSEDYVRSAHVMYTPTLIINGKYSVTASTELGIDFKGMLEIADQLIAKESATRRK